MDKPKITDEQIDTTYMLEACQDYIDFLSSDNYSEDRAKDYVNDIFEKAIESVYGENVWDYINSNLE